MARVDLDSSSLLWTELLEPTVPHAAEHGVSGLWHPGTFAKGCPGVFRLKFRAFFPLKNKPDRVIT